MGIVSRVRLEFLNLIGNWQFQSMQLVQVCSVFPKPSDTELRICMTIGMNPFQKDVLCSKKVDWRSRKKIVSVIFPIGLLCDDIQITLQFTTELVVLLNHQLWQKDSVRILVWTAQ